MATLSLGHKATWHWANQSLPYPINAECQARKLQVSILKSFVWLDQISHPQALDSNPQFSDFLISQNGRQALYSFGTTTITLLKLTDAISISIHASIFSSLPDRSAYTTEMRHNSYDISSCKPALGKTFRLCGNLITGVQDLLQAMQSMYTCTKCNAMFLYLPDTMSDPIEHRLPVQTVGSLRPSRIKPLT